MFIVVSTTIESMCIVVSTIIELSESRSCTNRGIDVSEIKERSFGRSRSPGVGSDVSAIKEKSERSMRMLCSPSASGDFGVSTIKEELLELSIRMICSPSASGGSDVSAIREESLKSSMCMLCSPSAGDWPCSPR